MAAMSEAFDIIQWTSYRPLAGTTLPRAAAHEHQQCLTLTEEDAIVKSCFTHDVIGIAPCLDMVKDMAVHLEFKRTREPHPALGKN